MEAIRRMCCRRNKGECLSKVQSDQLYMSYMALCFWYTCKTELVQCELLRSMPTVLTQRHFHLLWKKILRNPHEITLKVVCSSVFKMKKIVIALKNSF